MDFVTSRRYRADMGLKKWKIKLAAFMAAFGLLTAVPIVAGSVPSASAELIQMRGIKDGRIGTWFIDTDTGGGVFLPD